MKKSPISLVKDRFETKEKLVQAVQKLTTDDLWLDRVNSVKGLAKVSNSKLVRLHDVLSDAKQRFGSRQKLISSILELSKRTKDAGYQTRLEGYPLPRLLDMHAVAARAQKRTETPAKPKTKTAKKTAVKAAPAASKKTVKKALSPNAAKSAAKKKAAKKK
jgi:hypothetical protein